MRTKLYDEQAEAALLGAAFMDNQLFLNTIEPDDLGTPGYSALWLVCQKLVRDGVCPDLVTLPPNALPANMTPQSFVDACPSVVRATHYIAIIKEWARRRRLERAASFFAQAAYKDDKDEHTWLLGEARELLRQASMVNTEPMMLAQMIADNTPPIPNLIEQFLPGRSVMLFSGPGGDGKSYAALDLALCVARGTPWLSLNVAKSPVVIADLENDYEEIRKRAKWVARGHGLENDPPEIAYYSEVKHTLDDDEATYELASLMKRHEAGCLVLDSLVDFLGDTDENSNTEMGRVAKRLRNVVDETNGVVLAIHHVPKSNAQTPRGATALRNGVTVNTMVSRDGNTLTLKHDKNRRGPEVSIEATMNWGKQLFYLSLVDIGISRKKRLTDPDEEAILDAVGDDWTWSNEVINGVLNHTTHARSTIHAKLNALVCDGVLEAGEREARKPYLVRLSRSVQNCPRSALDREE